MNSEKQTSDTRDFFDKVSDSYRDKYKHLNAFHYYFFNQRLEKVTADVNLKNKTILDIGSGTGDLYDFIKKKEEDFTFYACDISSGMLSQSPVPKENKFTGHCYDIQFPIKQFDIITMMGVSTYMDELELKKTLNFIHNSLTNEGVAIITFTNKDSLDTQIRLFLKPFIKLFNYQKNVIGQGFAVYPKSLEEVKKITNPLFHTQEIRYLNHTVFPINLLFKNWSIKNANRFENSNPSEKELRKRSSDFILFLKKK